MFLLSSEQILNENSVSVFQGISTSFWPARLAHLPVRSKNASNPNCLAAMVGGANNGENKHQN
jgi:hypothetical protein